MEDMDDVWLGIEIKTLIVASEKKLPDPCRLGDHITDDDRREAIRRYFSDLEGDEALDDETLEKALFLFKEYLTQKAAAERFAQALVASIMGAS